MPCVGEELGGDWEPVHPQLHSPLPPTPFIPPIPLILTRALRLEQFYVRPVQKASGILELLHKCSSYSAFNSWENTYFFSSKILAEWFGDI